MKISSIIDIVQGLLTNKPSISFITQSHTKLEKVNDGDLFISSNEDDIKEAIKQGAFAIVYDIDLSFSHKEIALIKVSSTYDACTRLLRFHLSNLKINSLIVNEITFNLFNIFKNKNHECIYLDDSLFNNFEIIKNTHNIKNIISTNKEYIQRIYPNSTNFKIENHELKNLIVHSLFETSFSHKDKYFHKLKLPMIYIDHFINVIEHLNIQDIDNSKLKLFNYMQAIFISKTLQIVEYGKSNTFIIANKQNNTNYLEIAFLEKFYSYGKIKIIDTISNDAIINILKKNEFNAVYIKSKNHNEIIKLLEENKSLSKHLF